MAEQTGAAGAKPRPSTSRRVLQIVVSLVLVVGIFYFLFKNIDLAEVWADIREMTWLELVTLGIAAVWNLLTYVLVWMAVTPGLTSPRAFVLAESSTAVGNTLPAGAAVGVGLTYSMLGSWGFSRSRSTVAVLVSGVWNSFVKLGMPVLAVALVALQNRVSGARVTAALAGIGGLVAAIAVFAVMLRSERGAERVGMVGGRVASRVLRVFRRPPVHGWEIATTKFRARTIGLVSHRWLAITVATLVSHLSLYLVLLLTLRHVGVSDDTVGWAEVLAVFAFARLATAIPFTPGGLGVVEAVLIGGLVAAGADKSMAVASVLVYRALTWLLPIPIGVGCYLWWRRQSLTARPAEAASPVRADGS
ncbi:MAG TPA: lysylphosphatidylglycerol synthase transmembrane domain-containing protein [Actinomycetes bacterium]|nr:lysylphosphatidylglycerol synthase transmembrane domain-containing protein [Actinomycetes bacterium]